MAWPVRHQRHPVDRLGCQSQRRQRLHPPRPGEKVYLQGQFEGAHGPRGPEQAGTRQRCRQMVPFSAFASGEWTYGPPSCRVIRRIGGGNSGQAAPGDSSGEAMAAVEEIARQLPAGVGYSGLGAVLTQERRPAPRLRAVCLSLLVVFLCLAALYESWSIPFGDAGGAARRSCVAVHQYARAEQRRVLPGRPTTIACSAKNAILIVEFARSCTSKARACSTRRWKPAACACGRSSRLRWAFILGAVPRPSPNVRSSHQHAIGTGGDRHAHRHRAGDSSGCRRSTVPVCSLFKGKRSKDVIREEAVQ